MLSVFLLLSILPIIVISYRAGHYAGYNEADKFKMGDSYDTPIFNQLALERPKVFMEMRLDRDKEA
jgi:hypothetical protein